VPARPHRAVGPLPIYIVESMGPGVSGSKQSKARKMFFLKKCKAKHAKSPEQPLATRPGPSPGRPQDSAARRSRARSTGAAMVISHIAIQ
jgi:hypothetical protein